MATELYLTALTVDSQPKGRRSDETCQTLHRKVRSVPDFGKEVAKGQPLYEQVYKALRKALLQGQIKPGTRLTESRLATQLGVSRTPVREALRQLQQDGLVKVGNGGRVLVPVPDTRDIEDLYECRILLEVRAVERAARQATESQLKTMEDALRAAEQALASGDPLEALQHNTGFHDLVARASGNSRLAELLDGVRAQILYMRAVVIQTPAIGTDVLREHRHLLDCLRRRDPVMAAEAARRHLEADLERFVTRAEGAMERVARS